MGKNTRRKPQRQSSAGSGRKQKRNGSAAGDGHLQDADEGLVDTSEDEHGLKKADLVAEALGRASPVETEELKLLALQDGGFLWNNDLRRQCWLRLLQLQPSEAPRNTTGAEDKLDEKISRQIDLDVARAYGAVGSGGASKRAVLRSTLRTFFSRYPELHYYQGYHDVMALVLEVFPKLEDAVLVARTLSTNYCFVDAHGSDFTHVQGALRTIEYLVELADSRIGSLVKETPFWGVSMLITGFAHDVDFHLARLRIFDAIVASPPYFQLYLVAALPLLPDIRTSIELAEDGPHVHEAIRKGACSIKSVKTADMLVRIARSLTQRIPPSRLLADAEAKSFLKRESCLFKPFKFDPEWKPPSPRPQVVVLSERFRDSARLFMRRAISAVPARYWTIALVAVITAVALRAVFSDAKKGKPW